MTDAEKAAKKYVDDQLLVYSDIVDSAMDSFLAGVEWHKNQIGKPFEIGEKKMTAEKMKEIALALDTGITIPSEDVKELLNEVMQLRLQVLDMYENYQKTLEVHLENINAMAKNYLGIETNHH